MKEIDRLKEVVSDYRKEREKWAEREKLLEKSLKGMTALYAQKGKEKKELKEGLPLDKTLIITKHGKHPEHDICENCVEFGENKIIDKHEAYKKDLTEKFISIATPVYQKYKYDKNCLRNYVIKKKDFIKFVNLIKKGESE